MTTTLDPSFQTFGKTQSSNNTNNNTNSQQKSMTLLNRQALNMLPPEVEGPSYGSLFVEIGNVDFLTYDGQNYLEEGFSAHGKGINHLFANIKFWGDSTKGIYLRMANAMDKKNETVTNKFEYQIKCPEKTFEKYLDDMGVLVIDFFDTVRNQNIGTSKIMMKLFIKRQTSLLSNDFRAKKEDDDQALIELRGQFPITLTGNQNVKIGQFSISIVSTFAANGERIDFNKNRRGTANNTRQQVNLDDSFENNEKLAKQLSKQDKDKQIIENAFSDDRIPSSYQLRKNNSNYKKQDFDFEIDEKPTRERPLRGKTGKDSNKYGEKENQRNLINIDENEDTFSNQQDFDRIFARGEKLRQEMNQALDTESAWQTIHGRLEVPKRYIPPFLKEEEKKGMDEDELDNIYAIEVEGYNLKESQNFDTFNQNSNNNNNNNTNKPQDVQNHQGFARQETSHIRDMKFIKIKILSLRIEDEGLLHSLIDETFSIFVDVPLPDIYQKRIANQHIKLSNYDIISFNEFAFNSHSLYNFKIDEDTFNQLVQAQIKIGIDGKQVSGNISMIKLLMSKSYKLEVSIPLEQIVVIDDGKNNQIKQREEQKKSTKGKQDPKKKIPEKTKAPVQTYSKPVGHLTLEIQLQRGDNEEELARDYEMKLQKLQEQKAKEESQNQADQQKYLKFSMNQEPIFASLYLNISSIRNMCLNQDGSLNQQLHDDSFNQRQLHNIEAIQNENQDQEILQANKIIQRGAPRNLFVQYKAFPTLEKLKTNTVWQTNAPIFSYRTQFPVIMNPETLSKLQNFTFILEVWDSVSPAKEEFVGLVKIPLSGFCYSMKTTDDQIFSLNFLADQHCLYPMMVTDGFLPIYSPRLGLNVGELNVTLAMGTALQISRQIQKEQEAEKQILDMTFKTQMIDMMKQKQEEEQKLRIQLEMQQQQLRENLIHEPEKTDTPEKSNNNFGFQDNMISALNSMGKSPNKENNFMKNIENYLRQSLNVSTNQRDVDIRKMTLLNCLRKLFEEARSLEIQEINGDDIFKDSIKNFDGTIKKDEFLYSLLNKEEFTLTRTEIMNIQTLILDINRNDNNNIDIDELQFSYKQYLGYYESFSEPILELLQLFKRNIDKKIENLEQQEEFFKQIEAKAIESYIMVNDLKDFMDRNGIFLRDNCYDQLASYFDLDRNDKIHITSFLDYMRTLSIRSVNFMKVSPSVLTNRINNFIKEQILINPEYINVLENEFKIETSIALGKTGNLEDIPEDILLQERINAKLFQYKLKKQGTVISLWEVLTFFEYLNINFAKLYHEPQRYHHILFPLFYKFITQQDYEAKVKEARQIKAQQLLLIKESTESVFALAQDLNKDKFKDGEGIPESEEGIYSLKSEHLSSSEEESEVILQPKKTHKQQTKKQNTLNKNTMRRDITFEQKIEETEEVLHQQTEENRPFKKVKHILEIKVKELKNIPILDKLVKDLSNNEIASSTLLQDRTTQKKKSSSNSNQYIQNVAVKYSFPLDDDEVFQSDYLQLNSQNLVENNQFDYKVSINTVHNYILNKDEQIQKLLRNNDNSSSIDQIFSISLTIFDNNKEFVIGNAQLPVEDIIDIIDMHSNNHNDKQTLNRILFIYGTSFSQRENCIIGKMALEITYSIEKQFLSSEEYQQQQRLGEDKDLDNAQSCFLHKETFIKRKIPLNAVINVVIERIHNLKESIENIEHFAKIQQNAISETFEKNNKSSKLTSITGITKRNQITQNKEQVDRKRILTQIFQQGLNLTVIGSIFEEDGELQKRFPMSKHTSKLLYNTLNPIFNEQFEIKVQMDTKIFEYLKNKKAKFEVRHYIIKSNDSQINQESLRLIQKSKTDIIDSNRSQMTDDDVDVLENNDFIVLGTLTVPLLHLITKNNGIDGDFIIFDDYKQQMGALKLKIQLNHHSQQRPLYSQEAQGNTLVNLQQQKMNQIDGRTTMIDKTVRYNQTFDRTQGNLINQFDNQYLLGINFVELIFKNRETLFQQVQLSSSMNKQSYMYLKFRISGQNYQTKFLSQQSSKESQFLQLLKIKTFDIKKTVFIELDFLKQKETEEIFSKPLEIQLWIKIETINRYYQPEQENLLGSFFIELNELSKIRNKRVKDQNGQGLLQGYEGYFSLYDYEREQVVPDRLGCKLFLIKKKYETQLADAEVLFHNLSSIEQQIANQLDPLAKGYADLDDLLAIVQKDLQDPYLSLLKALIENLEYKNSDKVYYSPLFGVLPPYFKYMKRFDSFGVIEKFNKELSSIDSHNNGFVQLSMFRSILEHELKIKEKIVVDFIRSLRESDGKSDQSSQLQTLDINIHSHSFKNQIDYVILLRKIAFYFETKINNERVNENSLNDSFKVGKDDEICLKIDIESAMRLKNPFNDLEPPNTHVLLRLPFKNSSPESIQTQTIQKSSYPAWHLIGQQIKFQLTTDNIRALIDQPLEFEIYHNQLNQKDQVQKHLLGVAYVDLSQMIFVDGIFQMSGYFHILRKDRFQDGHAIPLIEPQRLSLESQGQIKLSVSTNTNLKQLAYQNPKQKSFVKENSPIKHNNQQQQQMSISFARESLNNVFTTQQNNQFLMNSNELKQQSLSGTQQKLIYSFNQINQDLINNDHDEHLLKKKHSQNMSALDDLISSLKRGRLSSKEQKEEEFKIKFQEDDMRVTRGYNQSQQLFQEFAKITQTVKNTEPIQQQKYILFSQNIVQEVDQENSEFDRENERQNVFNQSSQINQDSHDSEKKLPFFMNDINAQFDKEDQLPIREEQQSLIEDDDDFALNPDNYNNNNNNQQQNYATFQQTNVFERANLAQIQNLQEDLQVDQIKGTLDQQEPISNRQPVTEQKKKSIFDLDDDEEYDAREMERIAKILNSKKK